MNPDQRTTTSFAEDGSKFSKNHEGTKLIDLSRKEIEGVIIRTLIGEMYFLDEASSFQYKSNVDLS